MFVFESTAASVNIAVSNVTAKFGSATTYVELTGGAGAFLLNANGIAGSISGLVELIGVDGIVLRTMLRVDFKNYTDAVTLALPDATTRDLGTDLGDTVVVRVTGSATIEVDESLEISGNFTVSVGATLFSIDATDVSLFIGVPGTVGVAVNDGTFGLTLVEVNGVADFDLNASGAVELVGLNGAISLSGTLTVAGTSSTVGGIRTINVVVEGGTAADPLKINTPLGEFEGILRSHPRRCIGRCHGQRHGHQLLHR